VRGKFHEANEESMNSCVDRKVALIKQSKKVDAL